MAQNDLKELPDPAQNVLPKKAQEIYLAAYQSAWDQYKNPEGRRGNDSREEVAHKVAWAAVKQKYEKTNNKWQPKTPDS